MDLEAIIIKSYKKIYSKRHRFIVVLYITWSQVAAAKDHPALFKKPKHVLRPVIPESEPTKTNKKKRLPLS